MTSQDTPELVWSQFDAAAEADDGDDAPKWMWRSIGADNADNVFNEMLPADISLYKDLQIEDE